MKSVLLILLLYVNGLCAQTVFVGGESMMKPLLDKVINEYECNGISNTKFNKLDTIFIMQLNYPDVGIWMKSGSLNKIYLHKWLLNDPLQLEYTFKHELGHMHGLPHDTIDTKNMMYKHFYPPETNDEWLEMNKRYYADLKEKLNPKNKQ